MRGVSGAVMCALLAASSGYAQVAEKTVWNDLTGPGARGAAMGQALTALPGDATTAWWNPASIATLEGAAFSVGFSPSNSYTSKYAPRTSWSGSSALDYSAYTVEAKSKTIDVFSVAVPVKLQSGSLAFQLGYRTAFDMGADYDYDYEATNAAHIYYNEPLSRRTYAYQGDSHCGLTSLNGCGVNVLTGSVAWAPAREVSLGLSVSRWMGKPALHLQWNNTSTTGSRSSTTTIESSAASDFSGFGISGGLLFRPVDELALGLAVDLPLSLDYKYDYSSTSRTTGYAPGSSSSSYTRDGKIKWPLTARMGLAILPDEHVTLSGDVAIRMMSKAKWDYTYRSSAGSTQQNARLWPSGVDSSTSEQSEIVRVGGGFEWGFPLSGKDTHLFIRGGGAISTDYATDSSDEIVPFLTASGGLGVSHQGFSVDVAYQYRYGSLEAADAGDDKLSSSRVLVSLGYKLRGQTKTVTP